MDEDVLTALIGVQDRVRAHFGWSYQADVTSAIGLRNVCNEHPQANLFGWSPERRAETLEAVRERLLDAARVVLVGAAASREHLDRAWPSGTEFVAADGAVGACLGLVEPVCVVTDLDGGVHLDGAVDNGIPLIVHAHGDNAKTWSTMLQRWTAKPPRLVLTHQTHEHHPDMFNPGGFTDGDRAVCFVRWLGVQNERIHLLGYDETRVGPWSGTTDPVRKMEKLSWMAQILDMVYPLWRQDAEHQVAGDEPPKTDHRETHA